MSVRAIREESRCGERGKLFRRDVLDFYGRVAAYRARSSNRCQDWTSPRVPNAFDGDWVKTTISWSSIYCLTSTVSSRSTWSSVKEIVTRYRNHVTAREGEALFFVFADEVRASRSNMLVAPSSTPLAAGQFGAHVIWSDVNPVFPRRKYILSADSASATVTLLKQQVNVYTFVHEAAISLQLSEVGVCNFSTHGLIATGNLTFVDGVTNATVAAPLFSFPLRRPRHQLAGHGREQRCACGDAEAPCCPVVHRTFRRQHGDRKCTRQAPAPRRQSHFSVRRRQLRPRIRSGVAFTDPDRVEEWDASRMRPSWWGVRCRHSRSATKAHGARVAGTRVHRKFWWIRRWKSARPTARGASTKGVCRQIRNAAGVSSYEVPVRNYTQRSETTDY